MKDQRTKQRKKLSRQPKSGVTQSKAIEQPLEKGRYITGLDGLRAIAVLAVIAYHLNFEWAAGGLLGVTVFFVLSGYLITDLLAAEFVTTNTINFKNFWIRRARRLLPAMFTMLLVVVTYVTLFEPTMLQKLEKDTVAAILYVSNWWYIFQDLSYFESFGPPSLLTHFWSLAVEEQFYILWPLIIIVMLKLKVREGSLFSLILVGALVSAAAMTLLYEPGADPSRVYYGTDTRVFSLLLGASLAVIWPSRKLSSNLPPEIRWKLDFVGLSALTFVFYMFWSTSQYEDFLYQGGMVAISVASLLVVAVMVHPSSRLNTWLSFKPLRWIGVRSYGIYLWHFPVIVLTSPQWGADAPSFVRTSLQIVLILVLASLSWTFIENPIRKGALTRFCRVVKRGEWRRERSFIGRFVTIASILAMFMCVSAIGFTTTSVALSKDKVITAIQDKVGKEEPPVENTVRPEPKPETPETEEKPEEDPTDKPAEETPSDDAPPKEEKSHIQDSRSLSVIGDSVMIDVTPHLEDAFKEVDVDAKIGRQFREAEDIVQQKKSSGSLGEIVVIELGANGPLAEKKMHALIEEIGNRDIYMITTRVPKPWQKEVNDTIKSVAGQHENVKVVDWFTKSESHPEFIGNDGVHLTITGAKAYADYLIKHID
ncbi:acyltransferase family protein [Fictibacillus sp. b24]|uniref:acyltransferase family protein n=1 Tax=Fictibacillus sp. b24 TaxID=3055863 RepID=UPI0025A0D7E2|nr:acyltransferase family protein [Fictibacillus sp. b24]MDM5315103.1 acyltransferase family protein [Fictibacillus sp. b24]